MKLDESGCKLMKVDESKESGGKMKEVDKSGLSGWKWNKVEENEWKVTIFDLGW